MGMKGGAKLIVQREEFFDPPGAADGEFSPIRCLSALLEGQSSTTIQTIVAQFEDVLRNRPEAEIRNFLRKVTEEMRDMEEDLLTAFPYDEKMPELDQEVSEAGFNLLVGLSAVEDYEASLNSQTPKQPLTAFQEILDHLVPALHHFKQADEIYKNAAPEGEPQRLSLLPALMNGISPDAVRQLQEDLHSSAAPEFDITEIVRPVLHDTAQDTDILKVPEVFELALPRFKDPFESRPDFKDMWEEFEKRLQEFKDGGASVYEIKDLIGEFGDPELQKKCLEMVQKVEEQKLADPAINPVLDIADMNRLMRHSKVILQLEKDLTEQSVALMRTLQLMEEKKKEGIDPPSYEPVYDEFEKMVQQTAKLRNLLEDFKADPSPDKYQELMDLSQDLQEIQQEAAPEIATYNREAEEIRIAHERALEEQKLQIAEFAPQAPEASGPAMTTGGGVGGAF